MSQRHEKHHLGDFRVKLLTSLEVHIGLGWKLVCERSEDSSTKTATVSLNNLLKGFHLYWQKP